jgi:DNA-dependent RNA polymerase auxiliary subunit epsilon
MIHYVEEAKKEALKTVERYASQKNNRLIFEPFKLAKGSFLIVNWLIAEKHKNVRISLMINNNVNIVNFYKNRKCSFELGERFIMIFKVYFQESIKQVAVRENTKTIYVEADSERDVRTKIADRLYNVEYIEAVQGNYAEYEKQHEDFEVLEIE